MRTPPPRAECPFASIWPRRRAVVVLGTMLALAVIATGCGSTSLGKGSVGSVTSSTQRSPVIPWADATAMATSAAPTTTTTTLPTGPACKASTLHAVAKPGGAGLGHGLEIVVVTNVGPTTCWVGGYPNLVGSKTSGARKLLAATHGTYFGNRVPTKLTPGSAAKLYLGTESTCNALNSPQARAVANANTYTGLIIDLPGSEGTLSVGNLYLDTACGLSESEIGAPTPIPASPSPVPGSPASLTARSTIPAEVHVDSVVRYTVTLTNPTATPVSLTPCPVYSESLIGSTTALRRSYHLNCAVVSRIDPGTAVTFAMELALPRSFPSSVAKMSWVLDSGAGPYAGRVVQVLGPDLAGYRDQAARRRSWVTDRRSGSPTR